MYIFRIIGVWKSSNQTQRRMVWKDIGFKLVKCIIGLAMIATCSWAFLLWGVFGVLGAAFQSVTRFVSSPFWLVMDWVDKFAKRNVLAWREEQELMDSIAAAPEETT